MALHLTIGVPASKGPLDATSSGIAAFLPSRHLGGKGRLLNATAG